MSLAAPAVAAPRAEKLSYDLAPHALALAIFAICAFSPAVLNDSDTWWHIAAGDWMLAHRAVPHDPVGRHLFFISTGHQHSRNCCSF